jgi:hypothetical protein
MLVAPEHREKLTNYCLVKKVTQEVAVNEMIGQALERMDQDPALKAKLDKAKRLKAELEAL